MSVVERKAKKAWDKRVALAKITERSNEEGSERSPPNITAKVKGQKPNKKDKKEKKDKKDKKAKKAKKAKKEENESP